ncbi:MAG TPA: hypothetical protein V6C98_08015, partial [Thermosynechococcaceae cyanobacterium]
MNDTSNGDGARCRVDDHDHDDARDRGYAERGSGQGWDLPPQLALTATPRFEGVPSLRPSGET